MFEKDKIYISRKDSRNRIWLWKCSRNGASTYHIHRLLIETNGFLSYDKKISEVTHGWSHNILATEEEANWLEQCISNPNLDGKNIDDIPLLQKHINYEIY